MPTMLEVVGQLAKAPITREVLERTRLGRMVNDIRRQNKHSELNKKAKVRNRLWRDFNIAQIPYYAKAEPLSLNTNNELRKLPSVTYDLKRLTKQVDRRAFHCNVKPH